MDEEDPALESVREQEEWLEKVGLSHLKIKILKNKVLAVLGKYKSVSGESIGHIQETEHRISLKQNKGNEFGCCPTEQVQRRVKW